MRILLVEDEIHLAQALTEILKKNTYNTDAVHDGQKGLEYARSGVYDLVILDIMLPKMNGYEILKNIRAEKLSTPVMMLTAKSETEDKIKGLDYGADDYLTKPFETGEFLARVRALLRRKGEIEEDRLEYKDIILDKNAYELCCGKKSVKLGMKEYQIMEMLIANQHNIIPKERFIEKIWGFDSEAEYNNIEVYISFLRKKLAVIGAQVKIKATRGVGYYIDKED